MIHFTTLKEFKTALKKGNYIKIIESNLQLNGKWSDIDLGINEIIFIEGNTLITSIEGEEVEFSLNSRSVGETRIASTPAPQMIHHIYENTITFKVDDCPTYTFALVNEEISHCPHCKGTGMCTLTSQEWGNHEKDIIITECYYCKGLTITKEEGMEIQTQKDYEASLWCDCKIKTNDWTYKPKGSKVCSKHHYTCKKCKKITQIG